MKLRDRLTYAALLAFCLIGIAWALWGLLRTAAGLF